MAFDNAADVRAAVYEGLENLLGCGPAMAVTEHALKVLSRRGIHDKTEKVRLAAFRCLNKLDGHRFLKVYFIYFLD